MTERRLWWRPTTRQFRVEMEEEIRFHFEKRVLELERAGLTPAEARQEAARRFGDVNATIAGCVASDARRAKRTERRELFEDVMQDVTHAMRQLRRRPGFALTAVLTLGVAIGTTAAVYAVADHVLVRPLPYFEPDGIVTLWETDQDNKRLEVSPGNFIDWKEQSSAFAAMGLAEPYSMDLTGEGPPQVMQSWRVSEGFLEALGVRPIMGRLFTPEEYGEADARVAMVSHASWQRRFGGAADVLGRTLRLDGAAIEIIGVLPSSLEYPEPEELWTPKSFRDDELTDRRSAYMHAVARLRPNTTVAQAQAEMDAIGARLAAQHAANRNRSVAVVPLTDKVLGGARPAMLALVIGTGLLLLIACANLANLLVSRGLERGSELAVRGALGAGRARLARQLVTESLVVCVLGGLLGVLLAYGGIQSLTAVAPPDLPRLSAVALNGRVLLFLCLITCATGALFGILPSLGLSRPDLMRTLRAGTSTGRVHDRVRRLLVTSEIALCVVLLIGAGLLARSLVTLSSNDLGFKTANRAEVQLFLWDNNPSAEQRSNRTRDLIAAFEALPFIDAAAAVTALPFHPHAISASGGLVIEGAEKEVEEGTRVLTTVATPNYFDVMSIPLRSGRPFAATDIATSTPVAIINESLARTYFAGQDPIGRRIRGGVMGPPVTREIIGVVADVRPSAFDSEAEPELFVPHAQNPSGSLTFVAQGRGDANAMLAAMRSVVWENDPRQTIYHDATLDQLVGRTLAERRFQVLLAGVFSAIALALVVLGVYGVVNLWARQRHREFGLRLALGANTSDILRLVTSQGLLIAVPGLLGGIIIALLVTRWITHLLYGVQPTDPITFLNVAVLLVAVTAVAAYVPARLAARADPLRSMKSD